MLSWPLRKLAIFVVTLACGFASTSVLAFVSRASNVSVNQGGSVLVAMWFEGDGTTYENLDYLAYNNAVLTATSVVAEGPVSCSLYVFSGQTYIRAFLSQSPNNPIVSARCLITFTASANAVPGVYSLNFDLNVTPAAYCQPSGANCSLANGSVTITAGAPLPVPTLAFSVAPTFAAPGGTVTLAWSTTNADGCSPVDGAGTAWQQQGQLPTAASRSIGIPTSATGRVVFGLTCQGRGGSTTQQATVTIGPPPPPPALRPVELVNPTVDGQRPTGPSTRPSLSNNGRSVVFESNARNLVSGDTNGTQDVFLRDTLTDQTFRVSVSASGQQVSLIGGEAVVDGTGNRVVLTLGTGLAPLGAAGKVVTGGQVNLWNKGSSTTTTVSTAFGSTGPGNGASGSAQISDDGQSVVFRSDASNLTNEPDTNGLSDVFLYNVATGNKTRLSEASSASSPGPSAKAVPGVNACSRPAGGRVVCEVMRGTRMVVVAYALGNKNSAGTTVSFGAAGAVANGDSNNPVLSGDGRFAFFDSAASNLVPGDANNRRDVFRAEFSAAGQVVGVQRVSLSTTGVEGNGDSERAGTCGAGQYVTFESLASNFVGGDDGLRDVFARDLATGLVAKMSQPASGGNANGASSFVAFSPDCSAIAYATTAENIAAGGASNQDDVVAGASPFQATNVTGGWFDLAQSGHGLFVEHVNPETVVASWYTFAPDGSQTWIIGVGPLVGNSATLSMLRPLGGRFPPAFVSSSVSNTPFGQMTLRFDSCDSGLVTFAFPAPFGSGTMALRRPELAAGITCSPAAISAKSGNSPTKDSGLPTDTISAPLPKATGPVAALTGSWSNPTQSGHGFQMEVLSGDRLVVTWYVFTPTGEQMWLIGAGPISGQSATINPYVRPAGGRFIPNFNPALITVPSVGTLTVTALTCNTARVDYNFIAPFGSGSIPVTRITSVRGVPCTP